MLRFAFVVVYGKGQFCQVLLQIFPEGGELRSGIGAATMGH